MVDGYAVVRKGLRYILNREAGFEVCGEAEDAKRGLVAIGQLNPDIVVVEISLPGSNGIEFIKSARACHPGQRIVVLSRHDESLYAERALRAGALGYVMKRADGAEIILALRKALKGELHVSGRINGALLQRFLGANHSKNGSPVSALSDRELEVYEWIGHGKTTNEIASALGMSVKTVDSHRMHIKEKLQIKTAPELVRHAVHHVVETGAGNGAG